MQIEQKAQKSSLQKTTNKMRYNQTMSNYKLCFVKKPWAYFTTQDLFKLWRDGWDKPYYYYNAGLHAFTQSPEDLHEEGNITEQNTLKMAFDGEFLTPCLICKDTSWSVKDINSGVIAWLYNPSSGIAIKAGVSIDEFCRQVKRAGGNVYTKVDQHSETTPRVRDLTKKQKEIIETIEELNSPNNSCVAYDFFQDQTNLIQKLERDIKRYILSNLSNQEYITNN